MQAARALGVRSTVLSMLPPISPHISPYLPTSPQALGVRTVFNILGPLLNPTSCAYFLIGVYSEQLVRCREI